VMARAACIINTIGFFFFHRLGGRGGGRGGKTAGRDEIERLKWNVLDYCCKGT